MLQKHRFLNRKKWLAKAAQKVKKAKTKKIIALTMMTSAVTFLVSGSEILTASFANAQPYRREVSQVQNRYNQATISPLENEVFGIKNQHSDLTAAINSQNVNQLKLAWQINTDDYVSHTPLVEGDRLYFADWGGNVYAANAQTGQLLWKNKIEQPKTNWPWHGFAGTGALGGGMLFQASVEGTAFGIDPNTGKVIWSQKFTDDPQAGNAGALLYHDGLVYIPVQSVEEPLSKMMPNLDINFQGKVVALDARTGRIVWERQLVTAPQNGVAVWSSFALDPQMNALFFTTGNNYTGETSELADSLVAVNAKTGEILWSRQTYEHDVWLPVQPLGPDYDFAGGAQLFEANIGGQMRQLVGAGQKSGEYWVFDRLTGQPVWKSVVSYGGKGGGMHAEASVGDGRIYVWGNNSYSNYGLPPEKHPMNIKALDAATGKYLWVQPTIQPAGINSAGFLANDVYFVASATGEINAYRASDGKKLWTSPPNPSIGASLNVVGDTLYVGAGMPKPFGTGSGKGVFAYTANPQAMSGQMPSQSMQQPGARPPSVQTTPNSISQPLPVLW